MEVVLSDIPFRLDVAPLMRRLHIREGSHYAHDFESFARDAQHVAKPKALYKAAYIEDRGDVSVVIDGVTLTSRVLRVNLDAVHRVFPYVATCGVELEEWSRSTNDLLHSYWLDGIKEAALRAAMRALNQRLRERYGLGRMSSMAPGSLGDWPLREQQPLFTILGDTETAIGVRLSKSCLMIPTKSVSGIVFPTETSFESCQLCPRERCPGRRAPYDRSLYDRKYRINARTEA